MPLITNIGWNNWCLFPQDISYEWDFFGQQELSSSGLFICSSQLLSQRAVLIWNVRVLIKLHPIQQWILPLCNLCQFDKNYIKLETSLVAQTVKCLPTMWETWVQSLGQEDFLEKEMATHSSILAWKIPWTEEPGRLQSMGSHI